VEDARAWCRFVCPAGEFPLQLDGVSGRDFEDCKEAPALESPARQGVAAHALDAESATRLWQLSIESLA
jgi:hypothetical protein